MSSCEENSILLKYEISFSKPNNILHNQYILYAFSKAQKTSLQNNAFYKMKLTRPVNLEIFDEIEKSRDLSFGAYYVKKRFGKSLKPSSVKKSRTFSS